MDDDQPEANQPDNGPDWSPTNPDAHRRACDACRARKVGGWLSNTPLIWRLTYMQVRCNRESPCSHCITSSIVCVYAAAKPPKKRTRILLTPQYERKLDVIDNRLERAIHLLENLHTRGTTDAHSPQRPHNLLIPAKTPSSTSTPASDSIPPKRTHGQVVEGDSAFDSHSVFVNEFLQKVADTNSLQESSLELSEALDELSCILTQQDATTSETPYPHAKPIQRPSLPSSDMPPIKKAITLIRIAKTHELVGNGWVYMCLPFQRFTDMCLDVYFNEDYSEENFITVNAGLHSLFWDYSFHVSAEEREEYIAYSSMCRDNLETALSSLSLHLPVTSGMVLALLFGAFYAVELSKPSLSWTLSAKASELCQTLGYHRFASMQTDKPEDIRYKQVLFWSSYYIDKSLSLRLGRPSTIPDWDITIPRPSVNDPHPEPALAYFVLWIETARCQGNTYEMLYSPNSLTHSHEARQSRVEALVSDLDNVETVTCQTNKIWLKVAKERSGDDLMDFFYASDKVLRLSLLTLVYRAAPRLPGSATTFNSNCITAARATLEKHQECMEIIRRSQTPYLATYLHWTLLFTPFIPFVVTFCHVIETEAREDLARLQAFVVSIQSASSASSPAAKLHRLSQVLCRIAQGYVESRVSTMRPSGRQDGSNMDAYLNALGFSPAAGCDLSQQQHLGTLQSTLSVPKEAGTHVAEVEAGAQVMNDGLRAMNPMLWAANGAELESWIENNEAVMELFEGPGQL
ncbi:unnamed protein product [Clonostachys rosea]|uniref:Xylanolytic transcriptional activator regulatory domain-containing protein n=1 Tax=Bionectria ochroleuca TaxID=29856 RepID=A0ABY6UNW5_BIOOC|nr:unnamed protein product [Clonostachys rosea]